MSLLVKVLKQPRMHQGDMVPVGGTVKLPDDTVVALCDKGYAVMVEGEERVKVVKKRRARKAAAKETAAKNKAAKK
jgi:hypothetical protein